MNLIEYKQLLSGTIKPTEAQINSFIDMISTEHSWYKRLNANNDSPFLFYFDPNVGRKLIKITSTGIFKKKTTYEFESSRKINTYQQNYAALYYLSDPTQIHRYINTDESIRNDVWILGPTIINRTGLAEQIPFELIKNGTFLMSRYLHPAFKDSHDLFDDSLKISYSKKHETIIKELRIHIMNLADFVYGL
ncbi:MAG: hypothetical protein WCJ61_05790 [Paludibacter sp.]